MTLEKIRASEKATLTCGEVADVIGCKPYTLHQAAMTGMLPFPTLIIGRRVRIPRKPLLAWLGE